MQTFENGVAIRPTFLEKNCMILKCPQFIDFFSFDVVVCPDSLLEKHTRTGHQKPDGGTTDGQPGAVAVRCSPSSSGSRKSVGCDELAGTEGPSAV